LVAEKTFTPVKRTTDPLSAAPLPPSPRGPAPVRPRERIVPGAHFLVKTAAKLLKPLQPC